MVFCTKCLVLLLVLRVVGLAQAPSKRPEEKHTTVSAKQSGLNFSVSAPAKCTAGAPITLICVIDNQTGAPVRYYASGGRDYAFQIKILDSRGKDVPATRFGS